MNYPQQSNGPWDKLQVGARDTRVGQRSVFLPPCIAAVFSACSSFNTVHFERFNFFWIFFMMWNFSGEIDGY
jgi:hypothetical protein